MLPMLIRNNLLRSISQRARIGVLAMVFGLAIITFAANALGRDIYVDPDEGVDDGTDMSVPVRTIATAIRQAKPGDTIHLQPKIYRDYAAFYSSHGEPNRPITLDGHGATLEGCDPLEPEKWQEVEPGLFRNGDLTPLTDAMIDRWFFLWDGKMNRMGRISKAPSPPLKSPHELKPGEWTFVKDTDRSSPESDAKGGYIFGSFYLQLEPGQSLAEADIAAPIRPAGILITISNSNLVIRNLTATHVYNDGYNISGTCDHIEFENICAIDCGDDGISAHTDSQYTVDGFVSVGNATGICDTGTSQTDYRNIFIADCLAHDLFFIQSGKYSIENGVILSSAPYAVTLDTHNEPGPCRLALKNVYIERVRGPNQLSVAKNCRLSAERVTLRNLDVIASSGHLDLRHSRIEGRTPPEDCPQCSKQSLAQNACTACQARQSKIVILQDADWRGDHNQYVVDSIRLGDRTFSRKTFAEFQQAVGSEKNSVWLAESDGNDISTDFGVESKNLDKVPVPTEYQAKWNRK